MQRASATVLGASRLVLVTIRRGMREVTFLSQMYTIFKELTHTRDECPEK